MFRERRATSCYQCGGMGHKRQECPENKVDAAKCHECGSIYHKVVDCNQRKDKVFEVQRLKDCKEREDKKLAYLTAYTSQAISVIGEPRNLTVKNLDSVMKFINGSVASVSHRNLMLCKDGVAVVSLKDYYLTKHLDTLVKPLNDLFNLTGSTGRADLIGKWGIFNEVVVSNHTDFTWRQLLHELKKAGKIEYEYVTPKHEHGEWVYRLIDGVKPEHNPFCDGTTQIDMVTGTTFKYDEICLLYDNTFNGDCKQRLKGKQESIAIEYQQKAC